MTASWWHNFSVENATELSITMDAYEEADLDLYLFRDDNENGEFESGEELARSWSSTSSGRVEIDSKMEITLLQYMGGRLATLYNSG